MAEGLIDRCVMIGFVRSANLKIEVPTLNGPHDLWRIAEAASSVWVDANHELALIAALARRPARIFGVGRFGDLSDGEGLVAAVQRAVGDWEYFCPFNGQTISPKRAIELLSDWRRLIDRNRAVAAIFGVASWKRPTVDAMLWDGSSSSRYATSLSSTLPEGSSAAAWKSRTAREVLARLAESGIPISEIEDGMIRGRGLGANCVPPLSVVVDLSGIYFDPSVPSDLETILQSMARSCSAAAKANRRVRDQQIWRRLPPKARNGQWAPDIGRGPG
jgi:capsular polysaccharide export protein